VREETRKALAGAALGAIIGTAIAVVYTRKQGHGRYRGDVEPVDLQQISSLALHVLNVIRQLLSIA
jgi:hypothetical protein